MAHSGRDEAAARSAADSQQVSAELGASRWIEQLDQAIKTSPR